MYSLRTLRPAIPAKHARCKHLRKGRCCGGPTHAITQVHPKPGVWFENCGHQLVWVGLRVLTIYCMLTHTQCRRTGCKRFVAQITDPLLPKYLEKYEDIYLEYVFARSVLFTSSDGGTRYQPNAEDVLREDTPTPTMARVFTGVRRTAWDSDVMQLSTLRGHMMSLRHQLDQLDFENDSTERSGHAFKSFVDTNHQYSTTFQEYRALLDELLPEGQDGKWCNNCRLIALMLWTLAAEESPDEESAEDVKPDQQSTDEQSPNGSPTPARALASSFYEGDDELLPSKGKSPCRTCRFLF